MKTAPDQQIIVKLSKRFIRVIFVPVLFAGVFLVARISSSGGEESLFFFRIFFDGIFRIGYLMERLFSPLSSILLAGGAIVLLLFVIFSFFVNREGVRTAGWLLSALAAALAGLGLLLARAAPAGWILLICAAATAGFAAFRDRTETAEHNAAGSTSPGLILPLLVLLGLLLSFYRLSAVPSGVSGYEVNSGLSALQLLHRAIPDGDNLLWQAMERSYSGSATSPLFVYSVAVLFRLAGVSLFTLRSAGVFWAMVLLIILYHLVAHLFDRRTALLALFLTSISPWFLSVARVGNYAGLSLCYFLLVPLLFLKGLAGAWIFFPLTGAALAGFSFFYIPVKAVFPLLGLLFIHAWVTGPRRRKKLIAGAALILAGFFLCSLAVGSPFGHLAGVSVKNIYIGSPPYEPGFSLLRGARDLAKNFQFIFYALFYRSLSIDFQFPLTSLVNRGIFLLAWIGIFWSCGRLKNTGCFFFAAACASALLPVLLSSPATGDLSANVRRAILLPPLITALASLSLVKYWDALLILAPRAGRFAGTAVLSLFLAGTAISDLNRFFTYPAEPSFTHMRIFTEQAVRLLEEGYYLEIGGGVDPHQVLLIDFFAYPRTNQLAHIYRFPGIDSGHGLRWGKIGEEDSYRFWPPGRLADALARARVRERKTAILFENDMPSRVRLMLSAIREEDPEADLSPIIGLENTIVGYCYFPRSKTR